MVLTLRVVQNHEIRIRAEGADAGEAIQAMRTLVQGNFGEAE